MSSFKISSQLCGSEFNNLTLKLHNHSPFDNIDGNFFLFVKIKMKEMIDSVDTVNCLF